jgi:hypothetical protein
MIPSRSARILSPSRVVVPFATLALAIPAFASAQSATEPAAAPPATIALAGPLPQPPATIVRDANGRATVRAVRLNAPLRIDGSLDEALYSTVPAMSDFVQVEPQEGMPATEKTEVWVAFDGDQLYVSFRNWDSQPDRRVAKEMRRDGNGIWNGDDNVAFGLDTFFDRRNNVQFVVNSIGGRMDGQVFNERQWVGDWNTIWEVKTGRFDGGWTAEFAIPFKSLRYRPGSDQTWGFNAFRTNRWKNELSFLTPVPQALGQRGLHQASMAAPLVGLSVPSGARNLEVKPYAISTASRDRVAGNDLKGDVGLDVKYGVTQNLTADFTVNTDFAQVEADTQQVNLTRFSLFFPEKREFFLEGSGIFSFGTTQGNFGGGGGDVPILFYSRRIGLERGAIIPLEAGGRMTGRVGRFTVGLLNIQTGDDEVVRAPGTNFSAVRLKRDLLRRSSIGLLFTGRSDTLGGAGRNLTYGVDGTFAFFENLGINTYWARTDTRGLSGGDTSYRAQLDYAGDRYGLQLEHLLVGDNFNPGIGFVRRDDMRRTAVDARFSPRPARSDVVRKYYFTSGLDYVENTDGRLETRERTGGFEIEFQNADRFSVGYTNSLEYLPAPFEIATGVTLPVGGYAFDNLRVGYNLATRRKVSGNLSAERGTFYNGHKTAVGVSGGRVNMTSRFFVEPSYAVNWVDLVEGSFTTHLAGARTTFTPTALMFVSAFLQYNSGIHAVSANVRLRWEYRPGSELFVVFNEDRDTLTPRFPGLNNRAFIVKVNRLLRF